MALTRVCCCCDLRTGCIVLSWLQLILIALALAGMTIPLQIMSYTIYNTVQGVILANTVMYTGLVLLFTTQIIKGIACIALIWGLIKNQHLAYQPWLLICGIENSVLSLSFLVCLFGGFAVPYLVIGVFPLGFIVGIGWYFWFSVFAVYQRDMKTTTVEFSETHETISLVMNTTPNYE